MLRKIVFFTGGIVIFLVGVILYGTILNLREISLAEAMKLKGLTELDEVNIIVDKQNYLLNLYSDSLLVKSYRAVFGRNSKMQKLKAEDRSTPSGIYKICEIDTVHKYRKFLRLNYPNLDDATEALRRGVITQKEYDKLRFEYFYQNCPGFSPKLGGNIGIQGIGGYNFIFKNLPFVYNWTDGSIAVSNENIDEIYSVVKKGTKVVIK